MSKQQSLLSRLSAAVTDGRAQNIRYRQNELHKLHAAIVANADSITGALTQDTRSPSQQVEIEFLLTTNALQHFYAQLDFKTSMQEEYRLANGQDDDTRRIGRGLVVIRPTNHTRLFSTLAPVAAAIAAGNSVLLELSTRTLCDEALIKALTGALDQDTFEISREPVSHANLQSFRAILVDQTSTTKSDIDSTLCSNVEQSCIAIVDRTADVREAARAIVLSRFGFNGTSPFAPDIVVVNEFVKKEFFEACMSFTSGSFASQDNKILAGRPHDGTKKSFDEAEKNGQLSTFGSTGFVLADVFDRNCSILSQKIAGRFLVVASSTGLLDSLHILQTRSKPLLAAYHFGSPAVGKYLSQHLPACVTCVNQIPPHLLVGPAPPSGHPISYYWRYEPEMFSLSTPAYIQPPTQNFSAIIEKSDSELRRLSTVALTLTGQPLGHAVGFFEQGIFIGLGMVFLIAAPTAGYFTYLGTKALLSLRK